MARWPRTILEKEARRLRALPGVRASIDLAARLAAALMIDEARLDILPDGRVLLEAYFGFMLYESEAQVNLGIERMGASAFDRPWETRVGMEVDQNVGVYLTGAPLAQVTSALRPLTAGVETDVLGRDVPTAAGWTFVFRFTGHAWTTVLRNAIPPQHDGAVRAALVELSRTQSAALLDYGASDTMGSIGYAFVENGQTTETFLATTGEKTTFESTRRKVPRTKLRDAHAFVGDFLRERKAYVSGISPDYFFNHVPHSARTARAQNPGFTLMGPRPITTVPPFEAVDYLWFAPSPARRSPFSGAGSPVNDN